MSPAPDSGAAAVAPEPLIPGLQDDGAKTYRRGTHRCIDPRETVERLTPLLPVFGITRVANITGLDVIGIPVVIACRPNSRSLSVSQGKGLDLDAAKASALMESVELRHAERIMLPLKLATYRDLCLTHAMADVGLLAKYEGSAFHPDLQMLWVEGTDMLSGEGRWLPFETVHMNATLPLPPGSGCFLLSSNGLASGNHPLEAAVHAICELVERDAFALWDALPYAAQSATRIDLATVDDAGCLEVLDRYERARVEVGVWEITSDIGVSVFRCVIVDQAWDPVRGLWPAWGMGCHPAREVALFRALVEAAQSRLTVIAGSRDDLSRKDYRISASREEAERAHDEIAEASAGRSFRDARTYDGPTLADDLQWLLDKLHGAGLGEVIAVDLSIEGLDLPVVRVVIPGLEGFAHMPGYVAGARALAARARAETSR